MKLTITMTTQHQVIKEGTKSVWQTVETNTEVINQEVIDRIVDSMSFFKNLGGSERLTRNYTSAGYLPTELKSTSPDKQNRTIRTFNYEYSEDDK